MTFRPRNAYYLRISTNIVIPLFLYLDERHIDWMSDVVLQHVLADLRPLIIPKLQAEKDVHFGPGAASATNKRGTVEVHRGETYQFAYFFRKTESHTVLFKSRYFVTGPPRPEVVPKSTVTSQRLANRNPRQKRLGNQAPAEQNKRKRAQTKGKHKRNQSHLDEDDWLTEQSEEDMDGAVPIPREPRPVRKQRRIIADTCQEDDPNDVEVMRQDIAMSSPPPERDAGSSINHGTPVKPLVSQEGGVVGRDANHQQSLSPDTADIELVIEEEEKKPKPLLKLKYQSFPIPGHCLCVVVEPWPPLRVEAKLQPMDLGASFQRGSLEPSLLPSNPYVIAEQRAKTPLFFPEHDRAPSEGPFARDRTLPPVPLFHDALSRTEDDDYNDDLMNFSQTLNAAGHMHTITADDDDDMDGAVLFGDADEVRELL